MRKENDSGKITEKFQETEQIYDDICRMLEKDLLGQVKFDRLFKFLMTDVTYLLENHSRLTENQKNTFKNFTEFIQLCQDHSDVESVKESYMKSD